MEDEILEPLESYNKLYKDKFNEVTTTYFDELVQKSQIDVEANRKTIKEIKEKQALLEKKQKKRKWINFAKGVMITISIILILVSVIITLNQNSSTVLKVVMWVITGLAVVGTILAIVLWLAKITMKLAEEINKLKEEIQALIDLSWKQMAPLNALYDWNIPAALIEKTIPLFQMDKHFDSKKYYYMNKKYGLDANDDENASTYYVQSGSILGNPFLLCKDFRMDMGMKTYTGQITIHWTTYVHTKNGRQAVHHTQVLRASVQREAPFYSYVTYLVYGNDAAPKLKFSRWPSRGSSMDDKQLKKFVKKGAKDLDAKQKKDLMDKNADTNFTRLGNDEFEVLFGGTDRNNELEYRLLFTPLAQKNMIRLLKQGPFGDDFSFKKELTLNYIQSRHSQSFDYQANPMMFVSNDHDAARNFFINYNNNYFKNFFFEMAPLMSIPLYQQHKSVEFIYGEDFDANLSTYEHEAMANRFNPNDLKHPKACTPNIYKTKLVDKKDKIDKVVVTAHSFIGERRVTYVTKLGGDGRLHTIPVRWIEYIPVSKDTEMAVEDSMISRNEFNTGYAERVRNFIGNLQNGAKGDFRFERGLLATILVGDMVAGGSFAPVNMINGVTQAASNAINIEETVRALESELDNMEKSVQAEGEGVKNIDELDASTEKEVAEADVQVSSDDESDETEDEDSTESEE